MQVQALTECLEYVFNLSLQPISQVDSSTIPLAMIGKEAMINMKNYQTLGNVVEEWSECLIKKVNFIMFSKGKCLKVYS